MFNSMNFQKLNFPEQEKEILKFWGKEKIFEKSLKKTKNGPRFIFYEGPPFANGLPGIHHLLARAFKDIIIRYKTMRGFFVERKAGWDTHGLPIEIAAEKKIGVKTKGDIEKIGVEKFIQACKENIFTYKKEWEEFTYRIGYWLDFKNAYITCKNDYIESLWWILKKIWKKGLLYEDYKVVPYCPRCGTSLSSHELAQGYKKIKEKSIYVKFKVKNQKDTYLLVWTTTPWTLPGNVALAVGEDIDYVKIEVKSQKSKVKSEYLILAKALLSILDDEYKILENFKGKNLLNLEYEPLYNFIKPNKSAYKVISGDFITTEEGTGIVHIAPAFGEDDMKAGKENNLPILMPVDAEGKFKREITPWAGMAVKNANGDDANPLIIKDLEKRNLLFSAEMYEHDYPFCWRCRSPLIYYAKNSWFIKMTEVKKQLLKNNEKINWIPKHIKKGRFGEWLNEVKDWNLTRERYWGTPLPVWKCKKCGNIKVIGSIEELGKLSNEKIQDLHRPHIDKVILKCECGEKMRRVIEVIDCWFDSGAMPYAQQHYPFENKEKIDKGLFFPADFICEGIDQTRGWFYTLLAISTLLELDPAYKNVISLGLVLDSNGQKMSKSKGNIVKPQEVIDKFGADCARFYFYTVNQAGEPKKFDMKEIQDLSRKFFGTLQNSYTFFETYTSNGPALSADKQQLTSQNLLDKWIVSRLNNLNKKVVKNLDNYNIVSAARLFENFIDDLSNWYIRRSRRRFQKPKNEKEKNEAAQTLHYVFLNLVKLLAPFTPFISEKIYQNFLSLREIQPARNALRSNAGRQDDEAMANSVHLCDWPKANENLIDEKLEEKMKIVREIVAEALAERAKNGIKVRQPIASLKIKNQKSKIKNNEELLNLIKEEINVKKIVFDEKIKSAIELDTKITPELKEEGMAREIARLIQSGRKKAGSPKI
jgi:isoleucyl-tRNA synthetase